ncbi:MAG: hypothetical protein H0X67_06810 [Acidobacteria bacterium]|nr:hypothetical protein [Acidobacteriota bacterium]
MLGLFRPAPFIDPLPAADVDRVYQAPRRKVFIGIFVGYAAYYLVHNNLALAIPDILREHPEYKLAQLGTAMTGSPLPTAPQVPHGGRLRPQQPEVLHHGGPPCFRAASWP